MSDKEEESYADANIFEDVDADESAEDNNNAEANDNAEADISSANVADSSPAKEEPVSAPAATGVSKSGKPLSSAQASLQERRAKTLEDMRAAYTEAFGDDKKAPKAKAYHAAGLTTIRERDGESAFQAKLQEYIAENSSKYTGRTTKKATAAPKSSAVSRKASARPVNSAQLLNSAARTANANSAARLIESIEGMGATARELIQTMVATTKALAKELSKTNSSALPIIANSALSRNASTFKSGVSATGRKTRSNKGGQHKKRKGAALPPIPE